MIAARLVLAYLRDRPLTTALHVLLLAIGIAAATALLLFSAQSETRLSRDATGVDLVIGAKGSPLQLVMSAVFHADVPTGNVPFEEVAKLAADPRVTRAVPVGLGDAVGGFRIVGTTRAFAYLYGAKLKTGRMPGAAMEAVLGADAAQALSLPVGAAFHGAHGLGPGGEAHADAYTVVGVLAPTGAVIDRLVLTPLDSVWHVHDLDAAPHEATAILLHLRTPFAAMAMKREINATTTMVAARPPEEMARLFALVGAGAQVLRGFAMLLVATAALSVFVTLSAALRDRRGEIALLRAMGATRGTVFGILLGQGLFTAIAGSLLGLLAGHVLIDVLAHASVQARGFGLSGAHFLPGELLIAAAGIVAGVLAALPPAIGAYRTDVAQTLTEAP